MNLALLFLCLCICLADIIQVAAGSLQAGPILGAILYATLGLGVHKRSSAAYIAVTFLPIIPATALLLSLSGVLAITTPWTLPIFLLQLASAGIAGAHLLKIWKL